MGAVAKISADMHLNNAQYKQEMDKSKRKTKAFRQEAKKTADNVTWLNKSFRGAAQGISAIDGPLGGVSSRITAVNSLVSSGAIAWVGLGAAVAGASFLIYKSVGAFSEYEQQQLRLQGLLKTTGGTVGFTATQLDEQAQKTAFATLASVSGIKQAQGVLLTFKSVQGETFSSAIDLSQDMAAVMGGTAKSAALQLGKALEDPTNGLNSLRRAGVSFTDAERAKIKTLQESGDLHQAQTLILAKLKEQVGGAGSAEAGGVAGSVDTLAHAWDNLLIGFAKTTGSAGIAQDALDFLSDGVKGLTGVIDPSDAVRFNKLSHENVDLEKQLNALRSKNIGFFGGDAHEIDRLEERKAQVEKQMRELSAKREAEQRAQSEATAAAEQARIEASEAAMVAQQEKREAEEVLELEKIEKDRQRLVARAEKLQLARERELEAVELSFMTEEERLTEAYNRQNTIINTAFENREKDKQRRRALLDKNKKKYEDDQDKLEQKRKKKEFKLDESHWASKLKLNGTYLNQLANLSLGGSKKVFQIQKTAALASAAVSLPSSVMQSYENGGGYPWGLIPAGLMLVEGLSQINAIKNQSFGGGASSVASVGSGGGGATSLASPEIDTEAIIPEQAEKVDQVIRVEIEGWDEDALLPARTTRMIVESIAEQTGQNVSIG